MKTLLLAVVLGFSSLSTAADISINVPGEPIEVGRHYLLEVTGLEAADLPNTELIVKPSTASAIGVTGWAGEQFIWFSGTEAGRHFVAVVVHGTRPSASAVLEVGGETPSPDPPDPPTPGGPYKVWMLEKRGHLDNLPAAQAKLLTSLKYREQLEALGHEFQEVVTDNLLDDPPERLKAIAQLAQGEPLPGLVIESVSGGDLMWFALPANYDALVELLGEDYQ